MALTSQPPRHSVRMDAEGSSDEGVREFISRLPPLAQERVLQQWFLAQELSAKDK